MTGTILVTGASRGIGAATARLLAARGFAVAVNYQSSERAALAVVEDIRQAGGAALAVQADIAREDQVQAMFQRIDRELGPLRGLVNNAADITPRADILSMSPDAFRRCLDVNVTGAFLCCREAVRRMSTAAGGQGGAIVNLSSQAGTFGGMRITAYASSKAALNTFTIGLAREVGPLGIRVNAVSPGVVDTGQEDTRNPERLAAMTAGIALGRLGRPDEVAEAIAWLLSDASSYVTGTILPVAGGR